MSRLPSQPTTGTVLLAIGKVTFLEIAKDRILYSILVFAFLLLGISLAASQLSYMRQDRIILDFGLTSIGLSSCLMGILLGSSMMQRELERRTIYVLLCHPISRAQLIFGKFLGLVGILAVNWVLLTTTHFGILAAISEEGSGIISKALWIGSFFIFLQCLLISSVAVCLSTFSTTSLSVMLSIGFYLVGSNISQLRLVALRMKASGAGILLGGLSNVLPNLEIFNLGLKVTYSLPLDWKFVCTNVLYAFTVIALVLGLASFFMKHKEV